MNQTRPSSSPDLTSVILTVRDQRVVLAADLAIIYGVSTKALNQAVRRNLQKFPSDFIFQPSRAKAETNKSSKTQK